MIARVATGYLLVAGAVVASIGLGMVAMPAAFYGSYGIDPHISVDLANELRSPGPWLVMTGLVIGLGAFRPDLRRLSLGTAAIFYLSYVAARGVSIALDGLPGAGLMIAAASELVLGMGGAALWWRAAPSLHRP